MPEMNKRRHDRIDSLNLTYLCTDGNGPVVKQSMGRTLNVSESGICLETHFALAEGIVLTLEIAFENNLIDLKGKVVHCREGKDGCFEGGVEFFGISGDNLRVLKEFIEIFNNQ